MAKLDNETISYIAEQGFTALSGIKQKDFLDELGLQLSFVKAYLDDADKLPVTVLKVVTNKVARNSEGAMHSGALCVMFDHLSTFAVFGDPNWWDIPDDDLKGATVKSNIMERIQFEMGLSRNIKIHIQQPVPAGSTVYFVTKVLENTPSASYFFSQIFNEDGELLASGHHDKVKLTKHVVPKL